MSQSDVATGRGDVVRSRHRTIWRPAPFTVRAAGYLLLADASITIAAAVAVAGPTVLSRLTGLEMVPGASAQAPMVWEIALPSVIGAALGLAFAAVEIGSGLLLRRTLWWNRLVVSGLTLVGFALALVPGAIGMAFHFSGWAGALPGVKHALLAAALLLVWLPAASREFFRRPVTTDSADVTSSTGTAPSAPTQPTAPAGSSETGPSETGPSSAGQQRTGPTHAEPTHTGPTHTGPTHGSNGPRSLPEPAPGTTDSYQPADNRELTG